MYQTYCMFVADSRILPPANIAQTFHQSSQCFLLLYCCCCQHADSLYCKVCIARHSGSCSGECCCVDISERMISAFTWHQSFKQTITYKSVFGANASTAGAAIYQIAWVLATWSSLVTKHYKHFATCWALQRRWSASSCQYKTMMLLHSSIFAYLHLQCMC